MGVQKILVVDDDEDFLEEMKETLTLTGYLPLVISDSTSVFDIACRENVGVILLDLRMSRMSGLEVAVKLRSFSKTKTIPIICMTAYFTEEESNCFRDKCGIKKCLIKPIKALDMIIEIEQALEKKEKIKDKNAYLS